MPRGDRTGPRGTGPMSGRGAGYCAGYNMPGFANPVFGRGGAGMWGGRGWRNMYYASGQPGWARWQSYSWNAAPPMTPEQEQEALKAQETWLEEQLKTVRGQMNKEE